MAESSVDVVTTEVRGSLFLIGLNRPEKKNAAHSEMLNALSLAYAELDRNPTLRVGVLFAHGADFTAGLDLMDVGPRMAETGALTLPKGGIDPWGIQTDQVSKPVVMAIEGICFTLGVELALASDVVVASPHALFGQLEVQRGILPFGGATSRFPAVAGWSNAMRWLLTGETFGAQEAHRLGIVTELSETPLDRALVIASSVASAAPLAVQATLASARSARVDSDSEHQTLPRRLHELMATKDVQRGLNAFLSKQPATFEGD